MSKSFGRRDIAWIFAFSFAIVAVQALSFGLFAVARNAFTSAGDLDTYRRVQGMTVRDVKRVYGEPWKEFHDSASHSISGYRNPKVSSYAMAFVYRVRFGLVYVYLNEEGNVFWWEYCGG